LVVCSINVANHSSAISPSLKAGKNVYVEWPLGSSLSDAQTLLNLKNSHGVKLANVGLQARQAPIIRKVKEIIEEGKIGGVLSSTWTGFGIQGGGDVSEGMAYFLDGKVGGNFWTIHVGHAVDYVQAGMF
jgi:predicted dehydrogenase